MIITRKRALDLVSNPNLSAIIPEFHSTYELYKQKEADILRTKCASCRASKNLNSVGDQAINVMMSLGAGSVDKLKQFLGTTEPLYAYVSDSLGVRMVELGK